MNGDDLQGLKKSKRSELSHEVKCYNIASNRSLKKQVGVWFREHNIMLRNLTRGQASVYKTMLRVNKEKKKLELETYKKEQEKLREIIQRNKLAALNLGDLDTKKRNTKIGNQGSQNVSSESSKQNVLPKPAKLPKIDEKTNESVKKEDGAVEKHNELKNNSFYLDTSKNGNSGAANGFGDSEVDSKSTFNPQTRVQNSGEDKTNLPKDNASVQTVQKPDPHRQVGEVDVAKASSNENDLSEMGQVSSAQGIRHPSAKALIVRKRSFVSPETMVVKPNSPKKDEVSHNEIDSKSKDHKPPKIPPKNKHYDRDALEYVIFANSAQTESQKLATTKSINKFAALPKIHESGSQTSLDNAGKTNAKDSPRSSTGLENVNSSQRNFSRTTDDGQYSTTSGATSRTTKKLSYVELNRKRAREREKRMKDELDKHIPPRYTTDSKGEVIPHTLDFKRSEFNLPSNKERRQIKKLLGTELENKVSISKKLQSFHQQYIREDELRAQHERELREQEAVKAKEEEKPQKKDDRTPSLTLALYRAAFGGNNAMDNDLDPDSIDALARCGYLRQYDPDVVQQHQKEGESYKRKSSWQPTMLTE